MDLFAVVMNEAHNFIMSDASGKMLAAILGALIGAGFNWYSKRSRLKAAVRIEVQLTYDNFKEMFSPTEHEWFVAKLKAEPDYRIAIISSPRHVIIGNLTDDISYVSKSTAKKVILFVDTSGFIDDAIRYMRSEEFHNLSLDRKLKVLAVPFNEQEKFQQIAEELLDEL